MVNNVFPNDYCIIAFTIGRSFVSAMWTIASRCTGHGRHVQPALTLFLSALTRWLSDIDAYNIGCTLNALKGLTPYEFICKQWTSEPERFKVNPIHLMPGLNT